MKPILVPVDFSKPAENAARYAMRFSKIVKSNLILCNAFLVPAEATGSGQIAWPLYEYSKLENISMDQLEGLAKKLKITDQAISSPSSFHPTVSCSAVAGNITEVLNDLHHAEKVGMIIMGMSGAGVVTRLLMGSASRRTIEHVQCPVLLVPSDFKFGEIRKIALASDLGKADLEVIHSLAALAAQFEADLVITHVTDFHDTAEHHKKSEAFLKEVTNKINYNRIYYRHVKNADIDQGLDWLAENGKIDLLAMVHHQKGLLSRIFSGSHTKSLLGHIGIPLLVFPAGKHFTF